MNSTLAFSVAVVVAVLIAGTFLLTTEQGATTSTVSQSTSSSLQTSTTSTVSQTASSSVQTSGTYTNSSQGLELRLSVNASPTGGSGNNAIVSIMASEYNTLATANNVSKAADWGLQGLSLGACGTTVYPFGVALYSGTYTDGNVSQATPLQIHPLVACPLMIRLVTGYLFQPASDLAVVLPSDPNATATPMWANVTATAVYGMGNGASTTSPLAPGAYTVAAGDEWGSVVVVHFTVVAGGSTSSISSSSTSAAAGSTGTLEANFSVGPTQPVCSVNATKGPAPSSYSSIEAVVTPSGAAQAATFQIAWTSTGCEVLGSLQASLAPGSYTLSLSSCPWMGCSSALPRSFAIVAGQSTSVYVSIDTGIR